MHTNKERNILLAIAIIMSALYTWILFMIGWKLFLIGWLIVFTIAGLLYADLMISDENSFDISKFLPKKKD